MRVLSLPTEAELLKFRRRVLYWFSRNARSFPWRRRSAGTYVRIVSEVLLQRTQAIRIATFMPEFVSAYRSWHQLARANKHDLYRILQTLGLWRRRAHNLLALAREMERRRGIFPTSLEEIATLPGVGQYIGNAILLFAHQQRVPLLDVNMARVLERNFGPRELVDIRYDPYLQSLASRVVAHSRPHELNWAILDLAAMICVPRDPKCPKCPLVSTCEFARMRSRATRNLTGRGSVKNSDRQYSTSWKKRGTASSAVRKAHERA